MHELLCALTREYRICDLRPHARFGRSASRVSGGSAIGRMILGGAYVGVVSCSAGGPPSRARGLPTASAVASANAEACDASRARVERLTAGGRLESAVAESRARASTCGPSADEPTADLLRALGDDAGGDAHDSREAARSLVEEGLARLAAAKSSDAERAFAKARRMYERLTGATARFDGFLGWITRYVGNGLVVASAYSIADELYLEVLARIEPDGMSMPHLVETGHNPSITAGPGGAAGPRFVLGTDDDGRYYPSIDASPVDVGARATGAFSPSGARLVVSAKGGTTLRDPADGAVRGHFDCGAKIDEGHFLNGESAFVGLGPVGMDVMWLDLDGGSSVVCEDTVVAQMSPSGRWLGALTYGGDEKMHVEVWDLQDPTLRITHEAGLPTEARRYLSFDTSESTLLDWMLVDAPSGASLVPKFATAVSLATGKLVPSPDPRMVPVRDDEAWPIVAPAFQPLVQGKLVPMKWGVMGQQSTLTRSADGRTLALATGTVDHDNRVTSLTVVLFDAATKKLLFSVPVRVDAPSSSRIRFGPGDYLAFYVESGASGFIDRRDGHVFEAPLADGEPWWGPEGRYAHNQGAVFDLERGATVAPVSPNAEEGRTWLAKPNLQTIPKGMLCRIGPVVVPAEVCRDRLAMASPIPGSR